MRYEDKLKEEYLRVYKEVITELEVEEVSVEFTKEVKGDILDMFLAAQEDGASPEALIGGNAQEFVQTIIGDFHKRNSRMFSLTQSVWHVISAFGILCLMHTKGGRLEVTIDIFITTILIVLGDRIGKVLSRKYRFGKSRKTSKFVIEWGSFLIMVMVAVGISISLDLQPLFETNGYVVGGSCLVVSMILSVFSEKLNK